MEWTPRDLNPPGGANPAGGEGRTGRERRAPHTVWEPGYREWAPPPALAGSVACLWTRVAPPGGEAGRTLVLPDACCDLMWQSGRGAFVAGPDTGPWPSALPAGTFLAGIRLRPGAGGPALGLPLSALLDQRVGVSDLGTRFGVRLARLEPTLTPAVALRLLAGAVSDLVLESPADPLVTEAARLLAGPGAQAGDVAARLGAGERQLLRRCRAAVGYGPATLRRVLRFRRFVTRIDAGPGEPDLARLAAETGYADQAHLSRECLRLAGLPPTALAVQRRPAA
jgi:AraC-like DNA-binding protein